ncbi:MAG: glycogen debranching N-terminal domain-containing protein [Acidimicrobiales bacterium]
MTALWGSGGWAADAGPLGPASAAAVGAAGAVTVVEGATFCLSDRSGDINPNLPQGLFALDTRVLSRWELRVNGHALEPLTVISDAPNTATFLGRARPLPGRADSDVLIFRRRVLGHGMHEQLVLRNYGSAPAQVVVELFTEADFADVAEVREGRVTHRGRHSYELGAGGFTYGWRQDRVTKEVHITFSEPAIVEPGSASWRGSIAAHEELTIGLEAVLALGGAPLELLPRWDREPGAAGDVGRGSEPTADGARRPVADWRRHVPVLETDYPPLHRALTQGLADLGALRISDPEHPERAMVAAGAPWWMTVCGRDSLLTAWMTMLVDAELAQGVLETLARFQGVRVDADTDEQPGRILNEIRFGAAAQPLLGGGRISYDTIDATPLFVMLLGELRRWGQAPAVVERLLPNADAALAWIDAYGDLDGDGYVEYEPTEEGLHLGWKDSVGAIRGADGAVPEGPIALCEVQGYVYAAFLARSRFAEEAGDSATAERCRARALRLRESFNRDFWLPEQGCFALGLDGDKRPIDAVASNMGHCLWTGIVDGERAAPVAARLLSPELFSGWGIRTLASNMAAYNPVSYHSGSVWPHDTAICAAGLMRYGFVEESQRVVLALLEAAMHSGGRLPELFAGFGRDELPAPAPYPTACSPQAWAAAAPLLLLRTLLRFDPLTPRRRLWAAPAPPPQIRRLRLGGIPLGRSMLSIEYDEGVTAVHGLEGIELLEAPRPPY